MDPAPLKTGVAFLASGSRGNATLVYSDGHGVLIDCGLSAKETRRRIDVAGLADVTIDAIVVTHEHSDHVSGVRVLSRALQVPVHATRGTVRAAGDRFADVPEIVIVHAGDEGAIGGFSVRAFHTSHDAAEPVGYAFETAAGVRIGIATDTGVLTAEAIDAIAGCALLGIEANHDLDMLERGPYPYFLKERIRSDRGHLSNGDAGRALERLGSDALQTIVAMHISEQNNLPRLARASVGASASVLGLTAEVLVASQVEPRGCRVR